MKKIQNIKESIGVDLNNIKVTVTGAAGNIGYALIFMISQGYLLGKRAWIHLCLLELPGQLEKLKGIMYEL